MHGVKATPFLPAELVSRFVDAGKERGFCCKQLGAVSGCPIIAMTRRFPGPRPRVYLSSGVHGDEPAAPLALLHLLESGVFDDRAVWFLVPMLNPSGFERTTRENHMGRDLNRDYQEPTTIEVAAHVRWLQMQPRFDVTFCLHEDWESKGFYLYELNPLHLSSFAEPMINAVSTRFEIDHSAVIDGRPASHGIIRPESDPALRTLWPEAIYLRANHTHRSYTLESPSAEPVSDRIEMLSLAITTALDLLFLTSKSAPEVSG